MSESDSRDRPNQIRPKFFWKDPLRGVHPTTSNQAKNAHPKSREKLVKTIDILKKNYTVGSGIIILARSCTPNLNLGIAQKVFLEYKPLSDSKI